MNAHMNRVLAEQNAADLIGAAERQRLARDAHRPGFAARFMTLLRRETAQNGRPAAAPQAATATSAGCAPESF